MVLRTGAPENQRKRTGGSEDDKRRVVKNECRQANLL